MSAQPLGQQGNAQDKDPGSPVGDHLGTYRGTQGCLLEHDGYTTARKVKAQRDKH